MAAKVEMLCEQLSALDKRIAEAKRSGGSLLELEAQREEIVKNIERARTLLTEGSQGKVLKG